MQEMNDATISRYFQFLRTTLKSDNLFYCCNREYTRMVHGEVSEFFLYPWVHKDKHLIDSKCPWMHYVFLPGKGRKGPFPYINYSDGSFRHRLTILSTNKNSWKITQQQIRHDNKKDAPSYNNSNKIFYRILFTHGEGTHSSIVSTMYINIPNPLDKTNRSLSE